MGSGELPRIPGLWRLRCECYRWLQSGWDRWGGGTTAVDTFAPNGYGLYDMAGNVSQWCWDWYDGAYYSYSPGIDTRGPGYSPDGLRVLRGGDWFNLASVARCANRNNNYTPSVASN